MLIVNSDFQFFNFCMDNAVIVDEFVFADPDAANLAAIKTYPKAGLKPWNFQPDKSVIWMLLDRRSRH